MLDLEPVKPQGMPLIQGYGNMGFRISGEWVAGAAVVTPEGVSAIAATAVPEVQKSHLDAVSRADPAIDVLLVGCGNGVALLDPALESDLRDQGVAVEVMDTGAACRTLNLLLAENRRAAALLIPVP